MNDSDIRPYVHKKFLKRHHANKNTLVIDELGLKHGASRADVAVINGYLSGYEIKSDKDSLSRLEMQVKTYNTVFDYSTIIVGEYYLPIIMDYVSEWWGVVLCVKGKRNSVNFKTKRKPKKNPIVDPLSVAQLLWKNEVAEVLIKRGQPAKCQRLRRSELYELAISLLSAEELGRVVRKYLKNRKNWRFPVSPLSNDD